MSTNPLKRIPKRSEIPETGVSPYEALHNASGAVGEWMTDKGNQALGVAADVLLGEETGDPWYKDVAYGAVPLGSIYQRAVTGTRPGMVDLLPGEIGSALKLGMLPIAKFGAKEITKGAARMGKSARNTAKALAKESGDSPYTFYHRTYADNVDNIKKEGLTLGNHNYGRNTGDSDELPLVNWLSLSPSAIPVLRYMVQHNPESVAQFKVTIPRSMYHNTPKFVMPEGRGSDRVIPVPKGGLGTTNEGPYKILMYGDNIPPENLEQMSMENVLKDLKDEDALEDFLNTMLYVNGLDDSDVIKRIVRENPQLQKRVERVAESDYGDVEITGIDRPLVDELNSLTLPISERLVNNSRFIEEGLDRANRRITNLNGGNYEFDEGITPYSILHDELRRLQVQAGMNDAGDIVKKKYWRPESKVSDLLVMSVAPMREPDVLEIIPGPGKISKGSVSRGLEIDGRPPESRRFNTKLFKSLTETGSTPYDAAVKSSPTSRLNPDLGNVDEPMFMSWFPRFSKGAISRGIGASVAEGDDLPNAYRFLGGMNNPELRQKVIRAVMKTRSETGL